MIFGVLTGGGDCPGLNAAIRAVVRGSVASAHADTRGMRSSASTRSSAAFAASAGGSPLARARPTTTSGRSACAIEAKRSP